MDHHPVFLIWTVKTQEGTQADIIARWTISSIAEWRPIPWWCCHPYSNPMRKLDVLELPIDELKPSHQGHCSEGNLQYWLLHSCLVYWTQSILLGPAVVTIILHILILHTGTHTHTASIVCAFLIGHTLGTSLFSPPPSSGNQHGLFVNSPNSSGKVGFSPGTPNHPPVGSGTVLVIPSIPTQVLY